MGLRKTLSTAQAGRVARRSLAPHGSKENHHGTA